MAQKPKERQSPIISREEALYGVLDIARAWRNIHDAMYHLLQESLSDERSPFNKKLFDQLNTLLEGVDRKVKKVKTKQDLVVFCRNFKDYLVALISVISLNDDLLQAEHFFLHLDLSEKEERELLVQLALKAERIFDYFFEIVSTFEHQNRNGLQQLVDEPDVKEILSNLYGFYQYRTDPYNSNGDEFLMRGGEVFVARPDVQELFNDHLVR